VPETERFAGVLRLADFFAMMVFLRLSGILYVVDRIVV
jgi:hypothetical protein